MDANSRKGPDVFRRRRATDDVADDEYDDDFDDAETEADDEGDDDFGEEPRATAAERVTTGPWDVEHLPKEDATPRVDLGGVAVPIPDGIELRVEVHEDAVVGAALVDGSSQLVVSAFAAPKSSGIWDDVRAEIADSLRTTGGSAEHTEGSFGQELRARIPDETGGLQTARFIGVDGPRWFLRGLLSGPAATDGSQARRLEEVFRGIVVNRGADAMAPRDPLPLHLPREAVEAAVAAADADDENDELRLELQERGPEITEIR
jgi:hypothetical protein